MPGGGLGARQKTTTLSSESKQNGYSNEVTYNSILTFGQEYWNKEISQAQNVKINLKSTNCGFAMGLYRFDF